MGKNQKTILGIIDLGTNSVRFDVHELDRDGSVTCLHREKRMVRLGENVFLTQKLEDAAIRRSLEAFQSFQQTAGQFKVDRMVAFGTSALREVSDSADFVHAVKKTTGIELTVISGEEEARLIAEGILSHRLKEAAPFALMDIGGGSTEISLCENGKIRSSFSFPLGVARLQQVFLKTIPPSPSTETTGVTPLKRHIRTLLAEAKEKQDWPIAKQIIGSSGSVKALAKICKKVDGERGISRPTLQTLVKEMKLMTLKELNGIPGMEPKRADLILAGAVLVDETMKILEARRVFPTEYSLRDGILEDQLKKFQTSG